MKTQSEKLDGGTVQDLYHYALAASGNSQSTFNCELLKDRLSAFENLISLVNAKDLDFPYLSLFAEIKNEEQMKRESIAFAKWITKAAALLKIDPFTGERLP